MINEDLKNNFPEEAGPFPDLNRIRFETRIKLAPTEVERDIAQALLALYDRGQIEVSNDLLTGELMVKEAYLN